MVFYVPQQAATATMQTPPQVTKKDQDGPPEGGKKEEEPEEAAGSGTPPVPSQVQLEGAYSNGSIMFAESPLHSLAAAAAFAANNEIDRYVRGSVLHKSK